VERRRQRQMCIRDSSRVARLQLKSDPTKFEEGRRQGFLIAQLFY
jgi:hypothetical protein